MAKLVKERRRLLVVTHIDADGLASGSTVFASLARRGANVALRTVPDLDQKAIARLQLQGYEFYIFTDLASTLITELASAFGDRFLVIDHHQLSEDDMARDSVINAWAFGYDGGKEACSSSMAYFFASSLDPSNVDLSPLAVVGAVADRQDGGPGRSLTGLNRAAMDEAREAGLITATKDLVFSGRETRPIHEAVALTSSPYLKGLTGDRDAVLTALHGAGIELKDEGAWRTVSSLSEAERAKLTEVVASVVSSTEGATDALATLVGEVYTLTYEDSFTPLRDAREFATLLNACGRMEAPGVGVSICLGDRSEALKEAMQTLSHYRAGLGKALDALTGDPARLHQTSHLVVARCEGVVDERLLGPVISILTSSPGYRDKIVVGLSSSGDAEIKVSSRVGDAFAGEVNLGLVMREAGEAVGGVGGGHTMAAGARIPVESAEAFLETVSARFRE